MVEIFQTIMDYPLQFLAGLGISGGTIYGVFSFLKWIVSLITKKSKKAKELLNRQALVDAVVNSFGGIDNFIERIANTVIEKVTTNETINNFKQLLQTIVVKDNCPIELKAYIETILSQSGSEQLHLLYEQAKSTLIEQTKEQARKVINEGSEVLDETIKQAQEKIQPPETITESTHEDVVIQEEEKEKEESIDYV